MTVKITAAHIRSALRERYPATSHALMFEVGNSTGAATSRHADAVAMGLWPSRGLEVEGVEIKVSRSDWKRELLDHGKADAIQRFCDRWWIAAPKGLIQPAELPATWGLLELDGESIRQRVAAPKLEAQPLTRAFLAAMLRRASESDAAEVELLAAKRLEPMLDRERKNIAARNKLDLQQFEEMKAKRLSIEEATGIDLGAWAPSIEIIAAIKFALKMNISSNRDRFESVADVTNRLGNDIKELMSIFNKDEHQ